jgi:hypothetical protein
MLSSTVHVRPSAIARAAAALLLCAGAGFAQTPQAYYPLAVDENDATGNYGPLMLLGNVPPAPAANGVCVNGVYFFNGGQDARTPVITTLDANDFQLEVEFQIAALPAFTSPILVGGNGWRWIGFLVQSNGTFGLLHNNAMQVWSTTTVNLGQWYRGMIKYEAGMVELYLDGALVLQSNIGPLNTGNNLNFTTNNYSNGTAFNGCIRELRVSNDTTLGPTGPTPIGSNYCTAVPNSTGNIGAIGATGSDDVVDNDVTLAATDLPNNAFGYFLTSQTQGFVQNPGGSSGNLCLGGSIGRYVGPGQIKNTGATGSYTLQLNLPTTPQPAGSVSIAAGETWNFQSWYRDAVGGTPTSNFTNGLAITFN